MKLEVEIFQHAYWLQNAGRLKYCADILISEFKDMKANDGLRNKYFEKREEIRALLETNLLLTGYALENAIKGYLIYCYLKDNSIPAGSDLNYIKFKVWGRGNLHDLSRLFRRSDLVLDDTENDLLVKLSKYVLWKGRYHNPQSYEDIKKVIEPGLGDRHTSKDGRTAESILNKIREAIK